LKPQDRNAALIVVDMQKGFDDPTWGTRNNPKAELCVAMLLQVWRDVSAPVIHVHHYSTSPTGCFRPGTPGSEPKTQAVPLAGEAVYRKESIVRSSAPRSRRICESGGSEAWLSLA